MPWFRPRLVIQDGGWGLVLWKANQMELAFTIASTRLSRKRTVPFLLYCPLERLIPCLDIFFKSISLLDEWAEVYTHVFPPGALPCLNSMFHNSALLSPPPPSQRPVDQCSPLTCIKGKERRSSLNVRYQLVRENGNKHVSLLRSQSAASEETIGSRVLTATQMVFQIGLHPPSWGPVCTRLPPSSLSPREALFHCVQKRCWPSDLIKQKRACSVPSEFCFQVCTLEKLLLMSSGRLDKDIHCHVVCKREIMEGK